MPTESELEEALQEAAFQRQRAEDAERALEEAGKEHYLELQKMKRKIEALEKENDMRRRAVEKLVWDEEEEEKEGWDWEDEEDEEGKKADGIERIELKPMKIDMESGGRGEGADEKHNELMSMAKLVLAELDLEKAIDPTDKIQIPKDGGPTVRVTVGEPNTRPRSLISKAEEKEEEEEEEEEQQQQQPPPPRSTSDFSSPHKYPCPSCQTVVLPWVERCPSCGMATRKPPTPPPADKEYEYDLLKPKQRQKEGVKAGVKAYRKSQRAALQGGAAGGAMVVTKKG